MWGSRERDMESRRTGWVACLVVLAIAILVGVVAREHIRDKNRLLQIEVRTRMAAEKGLAEARVRISDLEAKLRAKEKPPICPVCRECKAVMREKATFDLVRKDHGIQGRLVCSKGSIAALTPAPR